MLVFEMVDLLEVDTADLLAVETADLLVVEAADLLVADAADLLVVENLAMETSDGGLMVEVRDASDLFATDKRDEDMTERDLLLGRCQPPDLLEADDLMDDTCDGAFSLAIRVLA